MVPLKDREFTHYQEQRWEEEEEEFYVLAARVDNLTTMCKEIGVEAERYNIHQQIFPKLKHMKLKGLPNLERWAENTAGEANSLVIFPELEILQIHYCQKLLCVPDCPVLKELEICGCPSVALSSLAHLTELSKLSYDAEDFSHVSMPLSSWPFLVNLDVKLRGETMATLEVETNQVPLENLRSVLLSGLGCFAAASSVHKMHLGLWECFAFVEDLCIEKCSDLVRWPTEELRSLIHLRSLSIGSCDSLEGKVSSSEEIMLLSHLEKFHITDCRSLLEIPMILPASLKELEFSDCPRLVTLPSSIGNLAMLKALKLNCCDGLKELPYWMDGLTSLEQMDIWGCPQIEKLPQGLLHQLPTLESLTVAGCPGLEDRCREGGEYFDLVSSIQHTYIHEDLTEQTEEEPRSNLKNISFFAANIPLWFLKMDSIRRIAGRGKAKVPSAVKKDKDESVVFFSELYKRDKERETSWNRISSEKTKPCMAEEGNCSNCTYSFYCE
uniref:Disease resistance protein At4g27190-like leucine-rich repeats domain-containing protein n=1 Tax=Oryza meridionalis TaxID=40149 RepID=A0A0E0ENJ6_9ORYZ